MGVRPELLPQVLVLPGVAERAQVVDEGVYPDICDLLLVPGDGHAPRLSGAADAEVLKATFDEAPSLVGAELRQDEIGPLVVQGEQAVLVGRKPEEGVLLLDVLGPSPVIGAEAVDQACFVLEPPAAGAAEASRAVLVDVAGVVGPLEE